MKLGLAVLAAAFLASACEEPTGEVAHAEGEGAVAPGTEAETAPPPAVEAPPAKPKVVSLVPEKGMGNWVSIDFGGEGEVKWENGVLHLGEGAELTGARWDGPLPEVPYEVRFEARKTLGDDFFCGLTVPVRGPETCVSLIVGGWGGGVVGISSIDGYDASENETTDYRAFHKDQWYAIRLRVTETSLSAWIDDEQVADVQTEGKTLGLRPGAIDLCAPFGIAAWQTRSEIRGLEWGPVP